MTSPKKQTVESPPALEDALVLSPGSPVTSDGDASDHLMDLDVFSCDMLPPLIPRDGDGLALDADDVGAIIGESDAELFGYGSSCGALPGLDTRFGPFDMDNLQGFCSSRVEGL